MGGGRGVAPCGRPIRKRVEPVRQGTSTPLRTNKLVAGGMYHSELLSSKKGNDWSSDYVVLRSEICLEVQGGIKFARDKNLPEITLQSVGQLNFGFDGGRGLN